MMKLELSESRDPEVVVVTMTAENDSDTKLLEELRKNRLAPETGIYYTQGGEPKELRIYVKKVDY